MLVVMTFNCVSLIMATVVMNIKRRGDLTQCPQVPRWLFVLCDRALGPLVCTLWKKVDFIPLTVMEQVIEQETAFDGPDNSLRATNVHRNETADAVDDNDDVDDDDGDDVDENDFEDDNDENDDVNAALLVNVRDKCEDPNEYTNKSNYEYNFDDEGDDNINNDDDEVNTNYVDDIEDDGIEVNYLDDNEKANGSDEKDCDSDEEEETAFQNGVSTGKHVHFYIRVRTSSKDDITSQADADSLEEDQGAEGSNPISKQRKREVRDSLRNKFKTHHPIIRDSVKRRQRRLPNDGQFTLQSTKRHSDRPERTKASDGTTQVIVESSGSISPARSKSKTTTTATTTSINADGIRLRKRVDPKLLDLNVDQQTTHEPRSLIDDHNVARTSDPILAWSPEQFPALKHAREINMRKRRWIYVAEVVDKFAFFVYLVFLTVSIFTVLFLVPVVFRGDDA